MFLRALWFVALVPLAACACAEPSRSDARDIKTLWKFVSESARCNVPDNIWLVLDEESQRNVFQREAFVIALKSYHLIRRYLSTCRVHRITADTIRLCNPVFGIHMEFKWRMRKIGTKKLPAILITRRDVDTLVEKGRKWLRLQVQANNGYFGFPPDWNRFVPLEGRCMCGEG